MLNKNDPLIAAVQKVMETNQAERNAVAAVNEKFGITDRKALPRERQREWDSAYAKVLTEGVESLDEAKLSPEHKSAITKKLQKIHGKGKVKFNANGATWSDGIDNRTHDVKVHPKTGKVKMDSSPYIESQLEEETLDEESKNMSKGDIASLRHPKKKITRDDLAALRAGEHKMEEAKKMKGDDPCWDNYEMIGMKKGKGGKEVPNCVPVKEQDYSATQPSKMGLKPDYAPAGTTPDYAKPTTQTVNRAAKTSMPSGTVKEAMMNKIMKKLEEKKMTSAEIKKEKEIKKKVDSSGMKASMKNQYGSKKGKPIYFATIRKKAMKAAE